jgi:Na+/H+ antiporter NhaA
LEIWHLRLGFDLGRVHLRYYIEHWINDRLMAIFMTFLALGDAEITQDCKLAVLLNWLLGGAIGFIIL